MPAASLARTAKVWVSPRSSFELVNGEVQDANALPSIEHWNVEPASDEVNEKFGVRSRVLGRPDPFLAVVFFERSGPEVIVVSGAVVSDGGPAGGGCDPPPPVDAERAKVAVAALSASIVVAHDTAAPTAPGPAVHAPAMDAVVPAFGVAVKVTETPEP